MIHAAVVILLLLLSGCQDTRPTVDPVSSLDVQVLVSGLTPGISSIVGQAMWTTGKGTKHYAINKTVTLLPGTPYVLECARITVDGRSHCMDRLKPYSRLTTTDAAGRFSFSGLGHGTYFLATEVCWLVDRGRARSCHEVQGVIEVQREGQTVTTLLQNPTGFDTQR